MATTSYIWRRKAIMRRNLYNIRTANWKKLRKLRSRVHLSKMDWAERQLPYRLHHWYMQPCYKDEEGVYQIGNVVDGIPDPAKKNVVNKISEEIKRRKKVKDPYIWTFNEHIKWRLRESSKIALLTILLRANSGLQAMWQKNCTESYNRYTEELMRWWRENNQCGRSMSADCWILWSRWFHDLLLQWRWKSNNDTRSFAWGIRRILIGLKSKLSRSHMT